MQILIVHALKISANVPLFHNVHCCPVILSPLSYFLYCSFVPVPFCLVFLFPLSLKIFISSCPLILLSYCHLVPWSSCHIVLLLHNPNVNLSYFQGESQLSVYKLLDPIGSQYIRAISVTLFICFCPHVENQI